MWTIPFDLLKYLKNLLVKTINRYKKKEKKNKKNFDLILNDDFFDNITPCTTVIKTTLTTNTYNLFDDIDEYDNYSFDYEFGYFNNVKQSDKVVKFYNNNDNNNNNIKNNFTIEIPKPNKVSNYKIGPIYKYNGRFYKTGYFYKTDYLIRNGSYPKKYYKYQNIFDQCKLKHF